MPSALPTSHTPVVHFVLVDDPEAGAPPELPEGGAVLPPEPGVPPPPVVEQVAAAQPPCPVVDGGAGGVGGPG